MLINSVQYSNNQNQPAHRGYVHKSVKKYAGKVVYAEIDKCISYGNRKREFVLIDNGSELKFTPYKGHAFLEKLKKFMKPQHKKSSIKFNSVGALEISNPISNQRILIFRTPFEGNELRQKSVWVNNKGNTLAQNDSTCDLNSIAEEIITTAKPEEIDEFFLKQAEQELKEAALYKNGINIIGKIKTRLKAYFIEKYAAECGLKTTAKQDAEEYIEEAGKILFPSISRNCKKHNAKTSKYLKHQWLYDIGKRKNYIEEY